MHIKHNRGFADVQVVFKQTKTGFHQIFIPERLRPLEISLFQAYYRSNLLFDAHISSGEYVLRSITHFLLYTQFELFSTSFTKKRIYNHKHVNNICGGFKPIRTALHGFAAALCHLLRENAQKIIKDRNKLFLYALTYARICITIK